MLLGKPKNYVRWQIYENRVYDRIHTDICQTLQKTAFDDKKESGEERIDIEGKSIFTAFENSQIEWTVVNILVIFN